MSANDAVDGINLLIAYWERAAIGSKSIEHSLRVANLLEKLKERRGELEAEQTFPLNPRATDERTVSERKWQPGLKPAKPQQPCDVGLFGDEHLQLDLIEMLQEPTNGE